MTRATTTCVRGCTLRGRHTDACDDPGCTGCLPALAVPGLLVCDRCEHAVRRALHDPDHGADIPTLWAEIGDTRGSSMGGGGRGANYRLPLSDARTQARDAIRACLTIWCDTLRRPPYRITPPDEHAIIATTRRLVLHHQGIAETARVDLKRAMRAADKERHDAAEQHRQINPETMAVCHAAARLARHRAWTHTQAAAALRGQRGAGKDVIAALCEHIDRHLTRLLADPTHADQLVTDILGGTDTELGITTHGAIGHARQHAGTSRRHGITVECPGCCGRVHIDPRAEWIECGDCGEGGVLAWWQTRLVPDIDGPMTADDVCTWIGLHHRIKLKPGLLRKWAERGTLDQAGKDAGGRALYDPVQVARVALERRETA